MIKIQKSCDFFEGAVGCIETLIDTPETADGVAVVTHPNPLFGGTNQNKVTATIARTLNQLGYVTIRPNFRGVGRSVGIHDGGRGETEDILLLIEQIKTRYAAYPKRVLSGFSFGAFVMTRVIKALTDQCEPVGEVILAGVAVEMFPVEPVISNAIILHGEKDEVIPLSRVLSWACPQELPVTVIPGADHFFSGKLHILKRVILQQHP